MSAASRFDHLQARKFLSFLVVGGLATAIHWGIAAVLLSNFGMSAVVASTIGFLCSAGCNFLANARFTFGTPSSGAHLLRFAVASGTGCLLNALVIRGALAAGWTMTAAQPTATLLVLLWNFTVNATWVFKPDGAR